jgi:hypothetical protein
MSAAEQESGASRMRAGERVCLVVLLLAAFALRTWRNELFFVGPDEGSYLNSALVQHLEQGGFHPLRWISEDVEWVQHMTRNYSKEAVTYQHSYLHQLLARWLYRIGFGSLQSVRLSSGLTGTLTVFFAWWAIARMWPARRRVGLLAAAIVAFAPLHVFYSRTGWGQIGFACFYLAYTVVLYRLLYVIPEDDRRAMRRAGWTLAMFSLLAYGWHEGVTPYIAGCSVAVLAAPRFAGVPFRLETVLRSRRTWTWVLSAIPVGLFTMALALFSSFAKDKWFNPRGLVNLDWWVLKKGSFANIFGSQRVDLLLGWVVIVLAIVGVVEMWRAHRIMACHVLATVGVGALVLFLGFGDAYLVRAYMPVFVAAFLFAGVGLAASAAWIGARSGHLVAGLTVTAVLGVLAFTSWTTMFGRVKSPFFVQHFYSQTSSTERDWREVDAPILERLRTDLRAGETVGVFTDKAAIFRLLDVGIRAKEDYLEGPPADWPTWVVGTIKGDDGFEGRPQRAAYDLVLIDTIHRWGLWRRAR